MAKPNILFILTDDMGYGDLGCYGSQLLKTPNIDRFAAEGTRFTQCYAGQSVCAPSRCSLLTGLNMGHARIRGNYARAEGLQGTQHGKPIRRPYLDPQDTTVATLLQQAGYRTCLINKWHLDGFNTNTTPLNFGFDEFHGWMVSYPTTCSPPYYSPQRFHDRELVDVPGNQNGQRGIHNTAISTDEAIAFLRANTNRLFFLYLAYGAPHGPYDVPDQGEYADKPWSKKEKSFAAMITQLDEGIGQVLKTVDDLGLRSNTVVFVASDNGPAVGAPRERFNSAAGMRGIKGELYEGGIRVPMMVRWPERVPAGRTSNVPWYFADFLPTALALAGTNAPKGLDGVSVLPTLLGQPQDLTNRFLYWEFVEKGFSQAVRWGDWKAYRAGPGKPLELYDLARDVKETNNVAVLHPQVVARIETYLNTARVESAYWPTKGKLTDAAPPEETN